MALVQAQQFGTVGTRYKLEILHQSVKRVTTLTLSLTFVEVPGEKLWVSLTYNSQKWILVGVFPCAAESSVRRSSETSCPKNLRIARKHPWWSLFINTENFRFWNLYHSWDSTKDLFLNNWTKFIGYLFLKKIMDERVQVLLNLPSIQKQICPKSYPGLWLCDSKSFNSLKYNVIFCSNPYKNPKK